MRARLAFALLVPSLALGANYEVPLTDVDDEEDILALEQRGDISTGTADILLELIEVGVDLNTASRDELYDLPGIGYSDADEIINYRKTKGRIDEPTELVGAGALTEAQLLLIAPFIRIEAAAFRLPIAGRFRLRTALSNGDLLTPGGATPPPAALSAKLKGPLDLSAGFVLNTTRRRTGSPRYDSLRDALVVDPFAYRVHLPRAWAMWKAGQRKIVAGTFTLGFAERLTLDNTNRYTPSGIYLTETVIRPTEASRICRLASAAGEAPCSGGENDTYITGDFSLSTPFRGVAGSIEDLEFGDGQKLSLYAFASYQTRGIYQYELFDRQFCDDPRDDSNPACKAPTVFVVRGSDLTRDTRLIYSTLPYLYDELAGGAHADFKPNERYKIGITGYGANNFFHAAPIKLDTQEWSRVPFGGPFGAIGLNGRAQFGDFGFFLEGARSFDSIRAGPSYLDPIPPAGGGGFGFEQRTVFSPKRHELELSLRYYDNKFANPYARPIAAPDEFEGQRARNEVGARLKYGGRLPYDFDLRASADFWVLPFTSSEGPAGVANLYSRIQLGYTGFKKFTPSAWVDARNRNLASSQHGTCSSGTVVLVEGDSNFNCSGDLYRIASRLSFRPLGKLLSGAVQGWVTWKDDIRYKDRFRQDVLFWAELRSQPLDFLKLRLRTRYLFEDVSDNTYLEQSLWTFLEATWLASRTFRVSLRYDLFSFLDKRDRTLTRVPNPEHRFFLDASASF